MKIKISMLLILLALFVGCASDDDDEEGENRNDSDNSGAVDDQPGQPDEESPEPSDTDQKPEEKPDEDKGSFCFAGGALLYENEQQFVPCGSGEGRFQRQVCQSGKFVNAGDCIDGLVDIPATEFLMGCNETLESSCNQDNVPQHTVKVSAFTIDRFEVTVETFEACIAAGACTNGNAEEPQYRTSEETDSCNIGNPDRANHPVNCVTWYGAKALCEWRGMRLPTEAEWEAAARSGKPQIYPWGNTPSASCDVAVMRSSANGCGFNSTFPIGSKPAGATESGLYDMAGNAAEFTNDWYLPGFYSTEEASSDDTQGPAEPDQNAFKVVRGGSYIYGDDKMRASFRSGAGMDDTAIDFGFRCVK